MNEYLQHLSNDICKSCNLTAVGIGVLESGTEPLVVVAGHRHENSEFPVEKDDRWHIGSITKSITSTLIAGQISSGRYDFDTPIASLLEHVSIHRIKNQITVKQLLTHTAKLQANYSYLTRICKPKPTDSIVAYRSRVVSNVLQSATGMRQGRDFQYSNVGYSIAGHIAETVAEIDFELLVQREIFEKCNLTSAGFGAPRGKMKDDEPMGHLSILGMRRVADPFGSSFTDNGIELSAAGRVHMNLSDLLNYGKIHLCLDRDGQLGITAENWNVLHSPVLEDYACGWIAESFDWSDGPILWHNGSNTLWYALLMILPAKELVLAFTTNNGTVAKAERAFFSAARDIVQRM